MKLKYCNNYIAPFPLNLFIGQSLDVFRVHLCNFLVDGDFPTNICIVAIEQLRDLLKCWALGFEKQEKYTETLEHKDRNVDEVELPL